jgi:SAM-dependent methyltransferase
MIKDESFESYLKEVEKPFSGWDFSYITQTGRMNSGLLTWSYGSVVFPLIQKATAMLDMGTGGGELLLKFQPFPKRICATEAYVPNVPIAKGVEVYQIGEDDLLPFKDNQFDLIINSMNQEEFPVQRFYDIGALLYYLKAIPWQVPKFKSENYIAELYQIHAMIQSKGYFDVQQHRFILKARILR